MSNTNNNEDLLWDEELIKLTEEYNKLSNEEKQNLDDLLLVTMSDVNEIK